jgi:DNA-binding NarL/FixJ family response regulator
VVSIKVLLVDDDALVRAGLRMILSSAEDLDVVGEMDDGARAVAAVRELRPDVVLMDIRNRPAMFVIEIADRQGVVPHLARTVGGGSVRQYFLAAGAHRARCPRPR